jgi:hypothetical protein
MEVVGTAQVRMGDDRLRLGGSRGGAVELVGDDRGDALVGECADRNGAGGDGLGACRVEILEQPENAEAGAESLLRMRPVGENGDDQPLGSGPIEPPQRRNRSGVHSA